MIALLILAVTLMTGLLAGAALSFWFSRRQNTQARSEFHSELQSIRAEMTQLSIIAQQPASAPPAPAFNLNRRPDAARRLRAGQPYDLISANTGWTVPEIALLQRVEALTAIGRSFD